MAERYPRIVEINRPLSKRAMRKSAIRLIEAVRGSTPCELHHWKNPARRELYDTHLDSRRLLATRAAARSERPSCVPAFLIMATQSGAGHSAEDAGPAISAALSSPGEGAGSSGTRLAGRSGRGTNFSSAIAVLLAPPRLILPNLSQYAGNEGDRREGIAPEPLPWEGKGVYPPGCWVLDPGAVPREASIECGREQIHLQRADLPRHLVHDRRVEGPLRGKDSAPGQEVRYEVVLAGALNFYSYKLFVPRACARDHSPRRSNIH